MMYGGPCINFYHGFFIIPKADLDIEGFSAKNITIEGRLEICDASHGQPVASCRFKIAGAEGNRNASAKQDPDAAQIERVLEAGDDPERLVTSVT